MKCIYCLKKKQEKDFSKDEHIIPAAFGGKTTLPQQFVCDDCNLKFGKTIEADLTSNSFISYLRTYVGPGKRGSLTEKNEVRTNIFPFETHEFPEVLGYIRKSKPNIIPQFQINNNDRSVQFFYNSELSEYDQLSRFQENIDKIGNYTYIPSLKLNEETILIGYIEEKFYICAKNKNNLDYAINTITTHLQEKIEIDLARKKEFKVSLKKGIGIKVNLINYFRVHSKIAFNCAAYLLGKETISDSQYNSCRNWINGKTKKYENIILNQNYISNIEKMLKESFPDQAHKVIIFSVSNYLIGIVSFYGAEFPIATILSKKFESRNILEGIVCDWKNQREYLYSDHLRNIAEESEL